MKKIQRVKTNDEFWLMFPQEIKLKIDDENRTYYLNQNMYVEVKSNELIMINYEDMQRILRRTK